MGVSAESTSTPQPRPPRANAAISASISTGNGLRFETFEKRQDGAPQVALVEIGYG